MKLRYYWKTMLSSFNPKSYKSLSVNTLKFTYIYLLFVLIVSFILVFALFLPKIVLAPYYLDKTLAQFERIDVRADIATKSPVIINNPRIVVDTSNTVIGLGNMYALVTNKSITYKPILCWIANPTCDYLKESTIVFGEEPNIKEGGSKARLALILVGAMLIPMIVTVIVAIHLLKFIVIIYTLMAVAFVFAKILRAHITFRQVHIVAIFAATPMIVIDVLNIRFDFNLFFIPVLIFLIYLISAIKQISSQRYEF